MPHTLLVVPCYNEADRLMPSAFADHCRARPATSFIFVNDGSTDDTLHELQSIQELLPDQVEVLDLRPNRGKAEAVRKGMLRALDMEPKWVGYWDADLATPLEEVDDFEKLLAARPSLHVVLGSRVRLLGREIERSELRHAIGRGFATLAALTLALPVYDTQCGAKLMRVEPELRDVFAQPFVTNWIFDVELLMRLQRAHGWSRAQLASALYEAPLKRWIDVKGSKVGMLDFPKALLELSALWRHYRF